MMTGVMTTPNVTMTSQSLEPGFRVYGKNEAREYNILHKFKMKGGKNVAKRDSTFRGRATMESPQHKDLMARSLTSD